MNWTVLLLVQLLQLVAAGEYPAFKVVMEDIDIIAPNVSYKGDTLCELSWSN
jgi:hypothetical protein